MLVLPGGVNNYMYIVLVYPGGVYIVLGYLMESVSKSGYIVTSLFSEFQNRWCLAPLPPCQPCPARAQKETQRLLTGRVDRIWFA